MATTIPFWSKKLFEKSDRVRISYDGIARKCHVTTRSAKNYIKRDIQAGLIVRQRNKYTHPIFKRLCDGRNTYVLTKEGRGLIGKKTPKKPPGPPLKSQDEHQLILDLLRQVQTAQASKSMDKWSSLLPSWWLQDLSLLQKTLRLFRLKIRKGYKIHSPIKWISSALKDQGCGYRQKIAQDVSYHLSCPECLGDCPEPIHQFYSRLQRFKEKGLDTSVLSLLKLLRKGFAHLGDALCCLEKLEKFDFQIENYSAFLNYLVSLNDPHSAYRKSKKPLQNVIHQAKEILLKHAQKLQFLSRPEELPKTPEKGKTYIQFMIHKSLAERSFIKIFQKQEGGWKEKVLQAIDPLFVNHLQRHICNP